jgi:hypothetical protein
MLDPVDVIYVNGMKCTGAFDDFFTWAATINSPGPDYYAGNDFLRLGARRDEAWTNTAADSTLDEIMIWEPPLSSTPPAVSSNLPSFGVPFTSTLITDFPGAEDTVKRIWQAGRYYRGTTDPVAGDQRGNFTSRTIDLAEAAGISGTGIPLTVFMVAWTQYVPYKLSPYEGAGVVDLRDKGATCRIDLTDSSKNPAPLDGWLPNDPGALKDPGGSPVKIYGGKDLVVDGSSRILVGKEPLFIISRFLTLLT